RLRVVRVQIDAIDVREEYQLFGLQAHRNLRRDRVRVDVVDLALVVGPERRDHGHEIILQKEIYQTGFHLDDISYMAEIYSRLLAGLLVQHVARRSSFGLDDTAIEARQSDRRHPTIAKCRQYFGIDLAAEYHLCEFERVVVGN